jgi:hypothetical protein
MRVWMRLPLLLLAGAIYLGIREVNSPRQPLGLLVPSK